MPEKTVPKLWPRAIEVFRIIEGKTSTWSELKHETNLSGTSLSDILRMLQERGLIFYRKVDKKYCNRFSAYEGLDPKLIRSITLSDEAESFSEIVEAIRSRKDTKKDTKGLEEKVMRANINLLTGSIPALIHDSLRSGRNAHQRLDDLIELYIRPQTHNVLGICLLNREVGESVTKEMRDSIFEQFSKEFDKYNEAWKEHIQN